MVRVLAVHPDAVQSPSELAALVLPIAERADTGGGALCRVARDSRCTWRSLGPCPAKQVRVSLGAGLGLQRLR